MTSMNELYESYANATGCSYKDAKEYFGDDKDVEGSEFVYAENAALRADFDDEEIELNVGERDSWKIKLNAKEKTFSGDKIKGSYTVKEKATKTLKDLNGDYKLNEENGYITINFANLPATLTSTSYNMKTGTEYKFIFNPNCDEYKKQ